LASKIIDEAISLLLNRKTLDVRAIHISVQNIVNHAGHVSNCIKRSKRSKSRKKSKNKK
jgi:hypothetical protein